jgi:predicted DNA binding CopG/RHH family protein
MKVKTTIHIYFNQYAWENKGDYTVFSCKLEDTESRTYVGEQKIEIDVPEDYDPRAQKIAALEQYKQKVMADYHKTVTDINVRISNLQALEYTDAAQ